MKKRHFIFLAGEQASGKTFQIKHGVKWFAEHETIDAVFVCDRLNEYSDSGVVFKDFGEFVQLTTDEPLPRVCVFQFGTTREPYFLVEEEAIHQGNVLLVLDEAYRFSPGGSQWRGGQALESIVYAGRHLTNRQGKICKVHLIAAAQYPKRCHLDMHQQAETVICSTLEGSMARLWVRENFTTRKKDALYAVDRLKQYQWATLRGTRPEWLVGAPK